jgi:2-polyprenyl-6-methoxyphenol hydroxylase-like FAD-dependent oxidoreductase
MAPNLGQGANSALVDGMVLAEELAGAPSVMDALTGYDTRRRPLARRVQKTAAMLQRLCGIEQVTTLRVRDALLAGLARSLGSARRASVGPWPPTSELSDRHPCSATPAEPTITKESRVDVARSDGQP